MDIQIESKKVETIKRRNRPTKKIRYAKERAEIISKLNSMFNVTESNNTFYLYDIINNEELKNSINSMADDIRKYYKTGSWNYYQMINRNERPAEIGLVRAVYRDDGWVLASKEKTIMRNGKQVKSVIYYLNRAV